MRTFIVVNIKTGELLYFDCPINCFNADLPTIPQHLIGYEPPNIEDFRLVIAPGLVTIHEARRREMKYDSGEQKIIAKDGWSVDVKTL